MRDKLFAAFVAAAITFGIKSSFVGRVSAAETATSPTSTMTSKKITMTDLEKYKADEITVDVEDHGKQVQYTGIPLRKIVAEMLPKLGMDSMPEWKEIARKKLVLEVLGEDGYPGLVSVLQIAVNTKGDRYIIATKCDGKTHDAAPQLICKTDEMHTRWVHQIVEARIIEIKE